jgi:hypothetical protein
MVMGAIVGTELLIKELEKYQKTNGYERQADLTLSTMRTIKKLGGPLDQTKMPRACFVGKCVLTHT